MDEMEEAKKELDIIRKGGFVYNSKYDPEEKFIEYQKEMVKKLSKR